MMVRTSSEPLTSARSSARIDLSEVRRIYPSGIEAVSGVSLSIEPGERIAIVGPSGSGKTTLLRAIAGLEPLDGGEVSIDGLSISRLPPHLRNVAFVFQEPALYPHLSVFKNIAFGAANRGLDRATIRRRVFDAASELELDDCLDRRPQEISGGQRGRAVLARAIVRRPRVLLLDEPLAHLDPHLRASARQVLDRLHATHSITTLLVTHDQREAIALGDRVGVMRAGRLLQIGPAAELIESPKHAFVARFFGEPPPNVVRCRLVTETSGRRWIMFDDGDSSQRRKDDLDSYKFAAPRSLASRNDQKLLACFSADSSIACVRKPGVIDDSLVRVVCAKLETRERGAGEGIARLTCQGGTIHARVDQSEGAVPPGTELEVSTLLSKIRWFEASTEAVVE